MVHVMLPANRRIILIIVTIWLYVRIQKCKIISLVLTDGDVLFYLSHVLFLSTDLSQLCVFAVQFVWHNNKLS